MARLWLDGTEHEVGGTRNVLHEALSLGYDLPYFCWHPALGSVGACRQCAVKQFKDEHDTRGRLVMACMTPASDGTRVSIADEEAKRFRAAIIEGLMESHPHDCPVCDEGGECHLQDMTVMTGHSLRRYRFDKRTFRNQDLGPFVNHEMNRCIQCYRCVRYYRDYAGGTDLAAFSLHDTVYFGRDADGTLESEFSGNLVEVCPTGVFTDKTLGRHYTRKWDLTFAPSICTHCSVGCNTSPAERYGTLRRVVNRFHEDVNGYFLCDRGRFAYEFVNSPRRLRHPLARLNGAEPTVVTAEEAIAHLGRVLASGRAIGIGSPRASLEANAALRCAVGPERFYAGVTAREAALVDSLVACLRGTRIASVREVECADAALVLGEDVPNTAPRLALAVRQSTRRAPFAAARRLKVPEWDDHAVRNIVQETRGPLFVATAAGTRLDDAATATFRGAPDDLARLGFAIEHALDGTQPAVGDERLDGLAATIASALAVAEAPVVVSGVSLASEAVLAAAAAIVRALAARNPRAALALAAPECNSVGLALFGAPPLEHALDRLESGRADAVIVLENDLTRRIHPARLEHAFARAAEVVVLDALHDATTVLATLALPAGTFAESDGTLVSSEGRAQRFFQVFVPADDVREGWRWLRDGLRAAGREDDARWDGLDELTEDTARAIPALAPIVGAAPAADFRIAGARIAREPHRFSGRTAMHAPESMHEPPPPRDPDSPLAFSMEGYPLPGPAPLTPFFWAPRWNSIQALNKFQEEIGGSLRGGPSGVRLFDGGEPAPARRVEIPAAFARRDGEWLLVPLPDVFASGEHVDEAPAIVERRAPPVLALHPDDAASLGLADGAAADVRVLDTGVRLAVALRADLPRGIAGFPAGRAPWAALALPAWARIEVAR